MSASQVRQDWLNTYQWFKLFLFNNVEFCDKVVEMFVACIHVGFLQENHTGV